MKSLLMTAIALGMATAAQAQAAEPSIDRAFAAMDANKDGKIDRSEYAKFIQTKHDRQAKAMDAAIVAMDKDKNGEISKAEAAAVPVIANAFDALDTDKNGGLSGAEMREALAKSHAAETETQ